MYFTRAYLNTTYRMTIDLLTEMPQITREIGLEPADLPHPSTLCLGFNSFTTLDQLGRLTPHSSSARLRARTWYREFRELALMGAVYNIKKAAEQEIPLPSGD